MLYCTCTDETYRKRLRAARAKKPCTSKNIDRTFEQNLTEIRYLGLRLGCGGFAHLFVETGPALFSRVGVHTRRPCSQPLARGRVVPERLGALAQALQRLETD